MKSYHQSVYLMNIPCLLQTHHVCLSALSLAFCHQTGAVVLQSSSWPSGPRSALLIVSLDILISLSSTRSLSWNPDSVMVHIQSHNQICSRSSLLGFSTALPTLHTAQPQKHTFPTSNVLESTLQKSVRLFIPLPSDYSFPSFPSTHVSNIYQVSCCRDV